MPYLAYEQQNGYLLLPYLEELIPADHVARVVNEVVDLLDIVEITSRVKVESRPAHHPGMMLKILFYSYSQKIRSSRVIARRCAEDVVFMWLAGMQRPDFRTISDFCKDNVEVLRKLFKEERDARFMKHCGGRIQLSYNCQAAVDEKEGVIVAEGGDYGG